MATITNHDLTIDSRDLAEYLDTLDPSDPDYTAVAEFAQEFEDNASDYHYGEVAIRDSYFTEYARELCTDVGYLPSDLPEFIRNNIDWEGVASRIQADYTNIEFDGVTYWTR